MKLKCINDRLCDTLTLFSIYEALEEGINYYSLLDDQKNVRICKKCRFVKVNSRKA